jgi:streptomycin 6-kinase
VGRAWLDALPERVEELAERWGLDLGEPYQPSGYTSWAAPAARDGEPCVLKVQVPDPWSAGEAPALRHYGGRACVRLLEHADWALLLERCEPGTPLLAEPDDVAATVVAETLAELWAAPPSGETFRRFGDVEAEYRDALRRSTLPQAAEARATLDGLLADPQPEVVLHADLHPGNVLRAARRPWLAIDPKGLVGERAIDAVPVVRDRATAANVGRRLDIVTDVLGLDRDRVRGWALVVCVESGFADVAALLTE